MSVLLYANGLTEAYKAKELVFTDQELLEIFPDFEKTRSFRLYEVPNTWCVWGERSPIDKVPDEFNKVGTDIMDTPCYSPVLFLHDSEVDPSWRLTENPIYTGYNDFKVELLKFFDNIAKDILQERDRMRLNKGINKNQLLTLDQVAISKDKRVIWKFDLEKQTKEFFIEANLTEFANKVHDFLKFHYQDGDIFAIQADKNIIIIMDDNQVKSFIDKLIALFKNQEKYEACSVLRNTYNKWKKYKRKIAKEIKEGKKSPVKKDPKKNTESDNESN